jgi:hypothetical protein
MNQDSPIRVRSNATSPSSCMSFCGSPTLESEAVSDQIDRLNTIITGMMKDLVHIEPELTVPEELSYINDYSPRAFSSHNPFHYVSPLISERDEMSVNCSSRALSLNLSVEERQLENEIELRLETEFLIYCRMSMCLEDYRSHELRNMTRSCYDTDLSDIEIRRDSCESPVSFRAYDDHEHILQSIASILGGKFGITFKHRTVHELVNSIENLYYRDVELTIKQISELESILQGMIDTAEKGQAVRKELTIGQYHLNLHVVEPRGDIPIPHKHRIARNLSVFNSEKSHNFAEEKSQLENYIKHLETEIFKLRTEVLTRPQIEDFSAELSKSMHLAFEEGCKPHEDLRSLDLNRTSTSSLATLDDIRPHASLDIEFKTLKTKRDEIEKLKNNIEWQLQDLIFLKKECEKREYEIRERERRLEYETQNMLYKERELYQLQENIAQEKRDNERMLRQINFERDELDKEKLEFETDKQLFEKTKRMKDIEAINLKENISRLLNKKEEVLSTSRQDNRPTSRLSASPLPFKLSSEPSLEELEMLKHEIERKLENPGINELERNRLGVQLSRIETQIASFKVKRVLEETSNQSHSMVRNSKLNRTWVDEDSRVLRKRTFQPSLTPQPTKRYRLDHDHDSNSKEDYRNFIHRKVPSECELENCREASFEKVKESNKENIRSPMPKGIKPLDLSKVFALESMTMKKSVNEEQLIGREEKLKAKENELIERMIKIRCKEIEQKEIEKLLEKERAYLSEARMDILRREKEWQATWMKIPDANELIPLVQKGHLTLMRELDNIYKIKRSNEKEKIEISKHWRQVTEGKRLIELQKKEIEQCQRDVANEKRNLCKLKENFSNILPAIQSMISV